MSLSRMRLSHLLRSLVRVPAFTGLVVFTLAMGIAANTAIFSVIQAVLLKPLPFHDSEQLIDIDHMCERTRPARQTRRWCRRC